MDLNKFLRELFRAINFSFYDITVFFYGLLEKLGLR